MSHEDALPIAGCNAEQPKCHGLGRCTMPGTFDRSIISSDGGGLLLSQVEAGIHILERSSGSFVEQRGPEAIVHAVRDLVWNRMPGLALG